MSLDQFSSIDGDKSDATSDSGNSDEDSYTWDCNWHIDPDGYWDDVDERFFGDGTPNQPPLMEVPEKMAAELHIIDDEDVVQSAAELMFPNHSDEYTQVLRVVYNDLSTWHVPIKDWDDDSEMIMETIVQKYVPEVIKWEAIINGENPQDKLEEWDKPWEFDEPEWWSDMDHTGISEETRKWLNNSVPGVEYVDRKIESSKQEVDLEVEDDDWTDDW